MPDRDVDRIRRTARALQAMHQAMTAAPPVICPNTSTAGAFELYYANQELTFAGAMSWPDADAMSPECYDPTQRCGWAWWAKRILDAADGEIE